MAVWVVALGCVVAGCGSDGGPTSTAETTEGLVTEPSVTEPSVTGASVTRTPATDNPAGDRAGGVPPFPGSTAVRTAESSGEWDLVLTGVRVVGHGDFDRIVLEFAGTGRPGWAVDYVDEAVLDGSGESVPLGGDAFLDIYASGTTWPADDYYRGPRQFEPEHGGDVGDVYVGGTFEGYTQVLVGIDGDPVPFRVFALTGPPRLVVDVD